jgi:hypothetical protein
MLSLGYEAVQSGESSQILRRNVLLPYSGSKNKSPRSRRQIVLLLAGYWLGSPFDSEDRGSRFLRNVDEFLANYSAIF